MTTCGILGNPDDLRRAAESGARRLGWEPTGFVPSLWTAADPPRGVGSMILIGDGPGSRAEAALYCRSREIPVVRIAPSWIGLSGYRVTDASDPYWLPESPDDSGRVEIAIGARRRRAKNNVVLGVGEAPQGIGYRSLADYRDWCERAVDLVMAATEASVVWAAGPDNYVPAGVDRVDLREYVGEDGIASNVFLVFGHGLPAEVALRAMIDGVPVLADGPTILGSGAGEIAEAASPPLPSEQERQELLMRVVAAHASLAEIREGSPLRRAGLPDLIAASGPESEEPEKPEEKPEEPEKPEEKPESDKKPAKADKG